MFDPYISETNGIIFPDKRRMSSCQSLRCNYGGQVEQLTCLILIFQRPMGLFSLIEEECRLARASDISMVDKLNKQFMKVDMYKKSKHHDAVFSIVHYASLVGFVKALTELCCIMSQPTHHPPTHQLVRDKWASLRENLSLVVCEQHRRRPACTSLQTVQRLCYSLFGNYYMETCYR